MTSLPDTKLALINYTLAHDAFPAGVTLSGGVEDNIVGDLPFAAASRVPGPPAVEWMAFDRCAINVRAWAATEKAAFDTAMSLWDVMLSATGKTVTEPGAVFMSVTPVTTPGELPDPGLPDLFRYTFSLDVRCRNS